MVAIPHSGTSYDYNNDYTGTYHTIEYYTSDTRDAILEFIKAYNKLRRLREVWHNPRTIGNTARKYNNVEHRARSKLNSTRLCRVKTIIND